jgi:hypothetical protein
VLRLETRVRASAGRTREAGACQPLITHSLVDTKAHYAFHVQMVVDSESANLSLFSPKAR